MFGIEQAQKASPVLKKCPVCHHEVSSDAISCPHCGHPIQEDKKGIKGKQSPTNNLFIYFLILIGILVCLSLL